MFFEWLKLLEAGSYEGLGVAGYLEDELLEDEMEDF